MKSVRFPLWLLLATLTCSAADPSTVRAVLLSTPNRKPAPAFSLVDAAGKTAKLKDYRGKVMLVDFWATWCHGCKEEIPWFSQFQRTYGGKGFDVVGISLDEDGWKAVKPFLADTDIPYRMLLGDRATAQQYAIKSLPDAFLIDRKGRIAAAYTGLVDKDNLEANIKALMAAR